MVVVETAPNRPVAVAVVTVAGLADGPVWLSAPVTLLLPNTGLTVVDARNENCVPESE